MSQFAFVVICGATPPCHPRERERRKTHGRELPRTLISPRISFSWGPLVSGYPLSTRHVEELRLERGVQVGHSTVNRWVINCR